MEAAFVNIYVLATILFCVASGVVSYLIWRFIGPLMVKKIWFGLGDKVNQIWIIENSNKIFLSQEAQKLLQKQNLDQLHELGSVFSKVHQKEFEECLDAIKNGSEKLEMTFDMIDGIVASVTFNSLKLLGYNFKIIFIEDITALSDLAENYAEKELKADLLAKVIDQLSIPVWLRKADSLDLTFVNQKYCDFVGKSSKEIIQNQLELGKKNISMGGRGLARRALKSRSVQSESHSISVEGKRSLLDFHEIRLQDKQDYLAGYALNLTQLDDLQNQLANYLAAHDEVLDEMKAAISIYSPDKRLLYHNQSFLRLFNLTSQEVPINSSYGSILELLRQKRLWPEVINFPLYKKEREEKISRIVGREDEMLHLPDGRTIQQITVSHPFGGVMIMMEDVTDLLTLESSFNTQLAVQEATINNLVNAVSVWGSDGRLKIWNPAFENIWQCEKHPDMVTIHNQLHIKELTEKIYQSWIDAENIDNKRNSENTTLMHVLNRTSAAYPLELIDGRIIQMTFVPLPDAQVMLINTDITDTIKVERALEERNAAIERADMLKSQFLSNVSYELRTPITAIQGFASILKEEFYGELNNRQKSYVDNILDAGEILTQLVKDILDLAVIQADLLYLDRIDRDLSHLLSDAVHSMQKKQPEGGQKLFLTPLTPDINFPCDQEYLVRAFENLLQTMISFTKGSSIHVSVNNAESEYYKVKLQSDWVITDIETRDFIQRRYLSNDYHTLRSGLGLKLSLASSLLELHDGRVVIDVESEQGFNLVVLLKKPVV